MSQYLTKKQQAEFDKYQLDQAYGRVLTPEGLQLVCESFGNNPEEIGKHFLTVLEKFRQDGVV